MSTFGTAKAFSMVRFARFLGPDGLILDQFSALCAFFQKFLKSSIQLQRNRNSKNFYKTHKAILWAVILAINDIIFVSSKWFLAFSTSKAFGMEMNASHNRGFTMDGISTQSTLACKDNESQHRSRENLHFIIGCGFAVASNMDKYQSSKTPIWTTCNCAWMMQK